MNSVSDTDKILSNRSKAIICILMSAFFFALMSFFVRLSGDVPTFQKSFFRNFIAALVALPVFLKKRPNIAIGKKNGLILLARVCFGTTGLICNYYAIDRINLSDANMLNKLAPFFAILASIVVLKEIPTKKDWLAIIIAFFGALLIIKPSMNMHFVYALIGTAGGAGAGIAYVMVRKLGTNGVDKSLIVLAFSTFSCLVSLPFSIIPGFHMTAMQLFILILAGCSAAAAQFSITTAYSLAAAKNISVFEFTQIIFAALLGMIFLGQTPDILSVIGYVVIIGCAVFKGSGK